MAEAAWSQSPPGVPVGIRNRSLTRQTADKIEAGSDTNTPCGSIQSQGERSSVDTALSASILNLYIDSEPIVSASDKRNKHILAQTCMQKLKS